jgi:hypothetical protein
MKASPALVARLEAWIEPYDTPAARQGYLDGDFPRSDKVDDLDTRYRWDLFYGTEAWYCIHQSDGVLLDAHIDTVLRKIIPPLALANATTTTVK